MDKSTDSELIPDVRITFDGLMLFHFDSIKKRCEIRFRRADAHQIEIEVHRKKRVNESADHVTKPVEHHQLIQFAELQLLEGHIDKPGTAVRGDGYNNILQLDGENFYGGMGTLKMKPDQYHLTLLLCVGEVGTMPEMATCNRVTRTDQEVVSNGLTYSFGHLKYDMEDGDWTALANEFKGLIKGISPFSRMVNADIDLSTGQNLILTGRNNLGEIIIYPLVQGYNGQDKYWIHIAHLDLPAPQSLGHCKGMAHLCESFELNGQPLYGVFAPRPKDGLPKPKPPWEEKVVKKSTDVTCCLCARVEQFRIG